jgi:hypothetical protein
VKNWAKQLGSQFQKEHEIDLLLEASFSGW